MVGVKVGSIPPQGATGDQGGCLTKRKREQFIMEITYDNQEFIVTALGAHIKSLRDQCEAVNQEFVTELIEGRISAIMPVLDALNSGEYYLELSAV